jgi:hypothetical protein
LFGLYVKRFNEIIHHRLKTTNPKLGFSQKIPVDKFKNYQQD